MGNQLNVLRAQNDGFENISLNNSHSAEDALKNEEIKGHFISSDPDDRDYFIHCPSCNNYVADTGLHYILRCETCSNVINLPDNNFEELRKACLYNDNQHQQRRCKFLRDFCYRLTYNLRFFKDATPIYHLPSFDSVTLFINKEKLAASHHANKDFVEIINNIILPFFQFKSRVLNKDKIFLIDKIEFKVVAVKPNLLSGKITSKTSITCNNYYSNTIPIQRATLLTLNYHENVTEQQIKNQIIATPFPVQLSIIQDFYARINHADFYVRNCFPTFGTINSNTELTILNRKIDNIKSVTFAVVHNSSNEDLNEKKNQKIITNNYIKPHFFYGLKRYIERGDIIKINDLELFVLRARPSCGFLLENSKIKFQFNLNIDQCNELLNNLIESEIDNNNNNIINTEINMNNNVRNMRNIPIIIDPRFIRNLRNIENAVRDVRHRGSLQERIRLLNDIFSDGDNFLDYEPVEGDNVNFEREYLHQQNVQNILRGLPSFKIDNKFLQVTSKSENNHMKKCLICLDNYTLNEQVKTLPCFHVFHEECIDKWFKGNNDKCPLCKNDVTNDGDIEDY